MLNSLKNYFAKFCNMFGNILTKKMTLQSGASRFHLFGVVLARLFFPQFSIVDSKTVQRSALCRSRQELSDEYLLAKFGFDTAENEP